MGCWGMGIAQSDEYCDVYDRFMERYNEGDSPENIACDLLAQYHAEFDENDGVMHDVYFALAKAEWMCKALELYILEKTTYIIESGSNLEFYRELGASDTDIKLRKKNLDKFLASLQTPRKTARKRAPEPKYEFGHLEKGTVFWYRSRSNIYGALVLDRALLGYYLVVLSEKLPKHPRTVEEILNSPAYTVAWFGCLLEENRMHIVGKVAVEECYNGLAGGYYIERVSFCENSGFDKTWRHEFCNLEITDKTVKDLINAANLPSGFKHREQLQQLIDFDKNLLGGQK